jgi:methionyl aminopeptidase
MNYHEAKITRKKPDELERMHHAGRIVNEVLVALSGRLQPGIATRELDEIAERMALDRGSRPAFKGYMGYPCSLCASVNQEVVHGIPSAKRKLEEGDIVSLDFGVECEGYYADAALTLPVGHTTTEREKLLRVTRESLEHAIQQVHPGNHLGDISAAVQGWVERNGYSVVREFVGHGIGTKMHEEPQVPNYGEAGRGLKLEEGMVIAIEPMVNAGGAAVCVLPDKWTAVTIDGSDSAHFEHTVAVTRDGPWVLTRTPEGAGPAW